ncbi:hypothetical protein [Thalassotalea eurytherma]|uniref:Chemotaxis protein n=1 Tax=Thalassotalea eurytherma TaxID=1144278 RepID=A0ABQ6H056_9GAMM|nr:hypothetical protein [Thalassotalea eurytherma]GLX80889.1 hypothetical protein theurythT_03410 [Thalassotalea eurytherma]
MGLFSSSKKTTTNQDNRTIHDYSGADFSQDWEIDNSLTGDYNNNTGTINVLDGGAIELAAQANQINAGLASESLSFADNAIGVGAELAYALGSDAIQAGVEAGNLAGAMHDTNAAFLSDSQNQSLGFADSIFQASNYTINEANNNNLDMALSTVEASILSNQLNNDFALDLANLNGEQAFLQQQDNNTALTNGFKSMMQFADSYSRSDGAQLAETNMKTVGLLVIGAVVSVFIMRGK